MRNCAADAEEGVRSLARLGVSDKGVLLREVGMLRSALEFEIDDDTESVDRLAEQARKAAHRASDHVNKAFFRQYGTVVWSH
jgi:protein involved in temperature-dependent protein secretion